MPARPGFFARYRFPASIIRLAVWLYYRFPLSVRDVETMLSWAERHPMGPGACPLFERGIVVSYESVRRWASKFGDRFGQMLRARERRPGHTWHLDEMEVDIRGHKHWLCLGQDGTSRAWPLEGGR